MKELSLHILDIVQNSVSAKATLITVEISESIKNNSLTVSIKDNGCGMSEDFLKNVVDPFTTTRTTRKVGLGIPLFKLAAEQAGGSFDIKSKLNVGTEVSITMLHNHIDRSPIGNMADTFMNLISMNESVDFVYIHTTDDGTLEFDTRQIREIMGDVPLSNIDVLNWITEYINENLSSINAHLY